MQHWAMCRYCYELAAWPVPHQECTFAPKTGRPPSRHRLPPGVPVEERLHLAQASKQEALERARIEREREALKACTFVPQLVTQPERLLPGDYAPPYWRAGEEAQRRSGKLAQARLVAVSGGGGCGVVAAPVDGALRVAACTCRWDASRPVRVVSRNFYATTSLR